MSTEKDHRETKVSRILAFINKEEKKYDDVCFQDGIFNSSNSLIANTLRYIKNKIEEIDNVD